jgi:hypothetical protein
MESTDPDPLANRHARIEAGLNGVEYDKGEPKRKKDSLELYSSLLDQQQILSKKIREVLARPAASRDDTLRECAARAYKIMETIKEMQGTC